MKTLPMLLKKLPLLLLLVPKLLFAQQNTVTFMWDVSTNVDVVGYRVYRGNNPGSYQTNYPVSGRMVNSVQLPVPTNGYYYWSCTAVTTNLESNFSNEVQYPATNQVPPIIVSSPINATNVIGGTQVFTVSAQGTGLTYQWVKNGVNLSNGGNVQGATTATLTLSPLTPPDAGAYYVKVTGPGGTSQSNTANLSIVPAAPTNFRVVGP